MRALYVLLGDPVAHSRSPAIHARAFALLGVDAVYAPCRVTDVPAAIRGLRALSVAGANVTVPHKVAVMPHLDRFTARAERIGAVNCIANRDGLLEGHNTDVTAIERALQAADRRDNAVVLGAGGSARAAVEALGGRCTIVARTRSKAEQLAKQFGAKAAATADLAAAAVVVNCTPVGMSGDEMPVNPRELNGECTVVDLVYAGTTGETALVRAARARRLRVVDGIEILVRQAIASLEVWLGRERLDELYAPLREAALA